MQSYSVTKVTNAFIGIELRKVIFDRFLEQKEINKLKKKPLVEMWRI